MRTIRILAAILLFLPIRAFCQLTVIVDTVPANTPAGDSIFMAGSFNSWNPGDSLYILHRQPDSTFRLTLNLSPGSIQYKFTRGSWTTVEGGAQGQYIPNRSLTFSAGNTVHHTILGWEDLGGGNPVHTADSNVHVLTDSFFMPQLGRYRRIWVYLPPDYDSSGRSYPVLYMQDGQNLFDDATAFLGEWGIDESLNSLFAQGDSGIIVIGIDNGGTHRLDEYSPYVNAQYGGGEGDQYADFLVNTLKPFIDSAYRTLPGREHTGIMGSSMGGLISFYAGLKYPEVFSKIGIFSPSFWFSSQIYSFAQNLSHPYDMRLYFLAGPNEYPGIVQDIQNMYNTLLGSGFSATEMKMVFPTDGQHSEWFWKREFPAAYQWLYYGIGTGFLLGASPRQAITLYPNPASSEIRLVGLESCSDSVIHAEVYGILGNLVLEAELRDGRYRLSVEGLGNGLYVLKVSCAGAELAGKFRVAR